MKIVIINPILYTCESSYIKKVKSIKDSMIYNLCLEFKNQGHELILIAAKDYEPVSQEKYDFRIIYLETKIKSIFKPNCFPWLKSLKRTIKDINPDYIISGEVFSMNSLIVSKNFKNKTIIWHELAKHNNILNKIPSKIWYNIIAKVFFNGTRIIGRSKNAQDFIRQYCNNVSDDFIDHGVDIYKFVPKKNKEKQFVIVSQLIERKHIDGIINIFHDFWKNNKDFKLIIIGSGDQEMLLKEQVDSIDLNESILFMGQLSHNDIIPILSSSYALIINTEKDNSMLSIVESIATATPIITTNIPYNSYYIMKERLGIVQSKISASDLKKIVMNIDTYINNCMRYRYFISNEYHVKRFLNEFEKMRL